MLKVLVSCLILFSLSFLCEPQEELFTYCVLATLCTFVFIHVVFAKKDNIIRQQFGLIMRILFTVIILWAIIFVSLIIILALPQLFDVNGYMAFELLTLGAIIGGTLVEFHIKNAG